MEEWDLVELLFCITKFTLELATKYLIKTDYLPKHDVFSLIVIVQGGSISITDHLGVLKLFRPTIYKNSPWDFLFHTLCVLPVIFLNPSLVLQYHFVRDSKSLGKYRSGVLALDTCLTHQSSYCFTPHKNCG